MSDGAGTVEAVGAGVIEFVEGEELPLIPSRHMVIVAC